MSSRINFIHIFAVIAAGTALVEESEEDGGLKNNQFAGNASLKTKSGSTSSNRMPGNIVCGICGAVRFYAFILQAKKFGTFSCEPCRKFISKCIKLVEDHDDSKSCHETGGQGEALFSCISGLGKNHTGT